MFDWLDWLEDNGLNDNNDLNEINEVIIIVSKQKTEDRKQMTEGRIIVKRGNGVSEKRGTNSME